MISKLEIEVETGRIVVHKDRRPHSDIGARQKLLDILLSYNPVWLRLGLEVRDLHVLYLVVVHVHVCSLLIFPHMVCLYIYKLFFYFRQFLVS